MEDHKNDDIGIFTLCVSFYHRQNFTLRAIWISVYSELFIVTVKPVCNDHLYNKTYYLWFIQ